MEADTLIELKTTDADGKISFIADLPIDGYIMWKELYAPDGFVTTGEEQEFVFEYQGDKEVEASYEFVFEDEADNRGAFPKRSDHGRGTAGAKVTADG